MFVLLALLAIVPVPPSRAHPLTATDLQSFSRISDPRVSPDGRWVVFNVRDPDLKTNSSRFNLWLASVDGAVTKRLTAHEGRDQNGRWLADSKTLVFLSNRSGSTQVWKMPVEGGEATQLSKFPLDVEDLAVVPNGDRLVLTFSVYPDIAPGKALEATAERDASKASAVVKARVYDQLLYRHWDSWADGKRKHLFVWKVGEPTATDLMPKLDVEAPPGPHGDADSIAVSPDGAEVVFAARAMKPNVSWTTNIDLYRAQLSGAPNPKVLTTDNPARDDSPLFSPDGRTLAYLAMSRPGFEADRQKLVLMDRANGRKRVLTESWDHSPDSFVFSPDSASLYVAAEDMGKQGLFKIDVNSGQVTPLYGAGSNHSPQVARDALVFLHETFRSPAELYTLPWAAPSAPKQITRLNAEKLSALQLGEYEQFSFPGAKGDNVFGYLVKPVGFKGGTKYPLVFIVHGGPQGSSRDAFH
ncbi:MAG: S9 family peptidase, partial [Myxococcaceae bacterium]